MEYITTQNPAESKTGKLIRQLIVSRAFSQNVCVVSMCYKPPNLESHRRLAT